MGYLLGWAWVGSGLLFQDSAPGAAKLLQFLLAFLFVMLPTLLDHMFVMLVVAVQKLHLSPVSHRQIFEPES